MTLVKVMINESEPDESGKFPTLWDFRIVIDECTDYEFDTAKEAEEAATKDIELLLSGDYEVEVEVKSDE